MIPNKKTLSRTIKKLESVGEKMVSRREIGNTLFLALSPALNNGITLEIFISFGSVPFLMIYYICMLMVLRHDQQIYFTVFILKSSSPVECLFYNLELSLGFHPLLQV